MDRRKCSLALNDLEIYGSTGVGGLALVDDNIWSVAVLAFRGNATRPAWASRSAFQILEYWAHEESARWPR